MTSEGRRGPPSKKRARWQPDLVVSHVCALSAGVSNVHEAESTDEEWSKETKDRSLSAVRHYFVHEDVQSWITHTGTVFIHDSI